MTEPVQTVAGPTGPATLAGVKELLGITTTTQDTKIQGAVDAANAYVWSLPARPMIVLPTEPPTYQWPADTVLGATMLAGRWYRRRNSPAGVESFSDLGGAVYVQRNDPDIAMMLRTGAYARPMVG